MHENADKQLLTRSAVGLLGWKKEVFTLRGRHEIMSVKFHEPMVEGNKEHFAISIMF